MPPTCSPYGVFTLYLPGTKHFSKIFIFVVIEKKLVTVFVAQSCMTLCNSMACSLPNTSVDGILQARTLKWVGTLPFSRGSSQLKDWTWVSCIAGRFFTIWACFYTSQQILLLSSSFSFIKFSTPFSPNMWKFMWHLCTCHSTSENQWLSTE